MSSTERSLDSSQSSVIKADIQRFAALPDWLARAAQPDSVSNLLTRSIPALAVGALTLEACTIDGLRLNTTTHAWNGTYTLTVIRSATKQRAVIPLQGTLFPPGQPAPTQDRTDTTFGGTGWRWYLPELRLKLAVPPPEPDLPILPQLTNRDTARALLEHAMHQGESAYRDVRIDACSPDMLRYHSSLRATVRYQLTYPPDLSATHDWPAVVVAKTYEGDQGAHAYDGMRALWNAPLACDANVMIAEPIAYLPALKLLIQGPVPGDQLLKTLIESAIRDPSPTILTELDAALHKTAAGLAALHRTPIAAGATYGWADQLAELRRFADNLAAAVPELAGAAIALLALLDVYAAATPLDSPVFAHGTFRPNHVLLHQSRVGLIDFDSWCHAEPARDLALFLTSIKDAGLSGIGTVAQHQAGAQKDATAPLDDFARVEAICDMFLDHYTTLMPVSRRRVALWEVLDIFTLVLRAWDRVKPVRLANTIRLLDRHMRRHFA